MLTRYRFWCERRADEREAALSARQEEVGLLEEYLWLREFPVELWADLVGKARAIETRNAREELEERVRASPARGGQAHGHGQTQVHGGGPSVPGHLCQYVKRWEHNPPGLGDTSETFALPTGDMLYVVGPAGVELGFPLTNLRDAQMVERRDGSRRLDVATGSDAKSVELDPGDEIRVAGRAWLVASLGSFSIQSS